MSHGRTLQTPEDLLPRPTQTLQTPEDLLPRPSQTLQNPEDLLPRPSQTLQTPEDLLPRPSQTLQNPEDHLPRPSQALQNPEDLLPRPTQALHTPEDLLPRPSQTLQTPEDLLPRPSQTLHTPEDLLPRPSQTLQNPEDLLPRPSQTLQTPEDLLPRPSQTLQNPEDHLQALGTNDSSVSQTHQDIHSGLTERLSLSKEPHLNQSHLRPVDADTPPSAAHSSSSCGGTASHEGETRLCGFLQKQGGPLKTWKWRWFAYEASQNQLFYYRTQHDVTPLGQVPLGSATFTCPLQAEGGTFHIHTPERTLVLKAVTQDLMVFWLQQLQRRRWRHGQPACASGPPDEFLPVLKVPLGSVGEAADVPSQRSSLANLSIKHPIVELQISVHHRRQRSLQDWIWVQEHNPAGPRAAPPAPRQRQRSPAGPSGTQQYLEQEVKAHKELVQILHRALESAQREKRSCAEFLAAEGEQQRLEVLRHRERLLVDLQERLEETRGQLEETRSRLRDKDSQVEDLREEMQMLVEKNDLNHEVMLRLSESVPGSLPPSICGPGLLDARGLQQLENLKDDLHAYKTQNQFLNSEIHQLMQLWRRSSEQEKVLMVKCSSLEAELCQLEVRHLEVLRTLQKQSLDQDEQATVQDMIRTALTGGARGRGQTVLNRDYDEYGFKILPDYEVEDMKLLAKIQALEIRTHYIRNRSQDGGERALRSRWAQYLTGRLDQDLVPSPELKSLLRAGVPPEYRPQVWSWLVKARTRGVREQHPARYRQLCEKTRTSSHPVLRQIQLDIHRTLTNNRNFCSPSSPALQQLRRVLLAFSWQNPRVGYCQGLNRLAALALLVLQSEEEAFWCLVAVVDSIMPPDYYTHQLVASQVDQRVLKELLMEKLPRLGLHLDQHGIDVSLVTFNWFLVVFVESLPSDILLPLWDSFLYEGSKVMFRFALALFKYKEDDFLKITDGVEIYRYLRFFTRTVSDGRKLSGIAFSDLNPFPGRQLKNRRAFHLERLKRELRELEEQQREFQAEGPERRGKDLDPMLSEDDEEL
ncbi:TBC1 domain family member 2A [Neosynchiropus ocellatus]